MQLAYVTVATVSGPMAMTAGICIDGVGTGRFMYCANVYTLLLSSGSAPQQPSPHARRTVSKHNASYRSTYKSP